MNKIWALICVSIAAQLGTFPLAIHYFNSFPSLFIMTNLVVIPALSLIIYISIALMMMSSISPVAAVLGLGLRYAIAALNFFIEWVAGFRTIAIKGVYLDWIEVVLIYFLITMIAALIIKKHRYFIILFLVSLILLSTKLTHRKTKQLQRHEIIEYKIPGHKAIDVIQGRHHYFVADSVLLSDQKTMKYKIQGNWIQSGLDDPEIIMLDTLWLSNANENKMLIE